MSVPRPCSVAGCERPVAGRGLCRAHWSRWRASADESELRAPVGSLTAEEVARALGLSRGSLANRVGVFPPDGRVGGVRGRPWWWPATVQRFQRQGRPAGFLDVLEVAAELGVSVRQVRSRTGFAPDLRQGGRGWWSLGRVAQAKAMAPPPDAVFIRDVAARLGVGVAAARRRVRQVAPADGVMGRRLWWHEATLRVLLEEGGAGARLRAVAREGRGRRSGQRPSSRG